MSERRMTAEQYLYPQAIYALNRTLHEVWDNYVYPKQSEEEKPTVVLSLFDKKSRVFHWLSVLSTRWEFKDGFNPQCFQNITGQAGWFAFREEMMSKGLRHLVEAVEYVEHFQGSGDHSRELWRDYHRHLLALYEGYDFVANCYLDGIIYRNLGKDTRQRDVRITYAQGRLLPESTPTTYTEYPWVKITIVGSNDQSLPRRLRLPRFQCQEAEEQKPSKKTIKKPMSVSATRASFEIQKSLFNGLFPLGDEASVQGNHFLIIPLYDIFLDGKGYGNLWGNLVLLFSTSDSLTKFAKQRKRDVLIRETHRFNPGLESAAVARILEQALSSSLNLIDHFAQHLVFLQDWEQVVICEQEGDNRWVPQYCYQHIPHEDGVQTDWRRCEHSRGHHNVSALCLDTFEDGPVFQKGADMYLRWNYDLGDPAFLPDLIEVERARFTPIRLLFKFPRTAVVPADDERRKVLGDFYIRQQLGLLQGLAVKVRARRSALRTAAVAIMGRNMSHNIGSHVLVRLSTWVALDALIEKDYSPVLPEDRHRMMRTFLSYLQERMDFLAEISTAVPFFSLSMWIGRDVIGPFCKQYVLQQYISGIQGVTAELKLHCEGIELDFDLSRQGSDRLYSSAGGRLGAQALYTILENVIRNTAKHCLRDKETTVRINVGVRELEAEESLYEVLIWDIHGNTRHIVDGKPLCEYLNSTITSSIIDESGNVRSQNWGVREMLICAAYLRQIPLEDLEQELPGQPLLQAVRVNEKGCRLDGDQGNGYLGYRFFLPKPQELLIFGELPNMDKELLDRHRLELRHKGIEVVTDTRALEDRLLQGVWHTFLLWLSPDMTMYDAWGLSLPARVFVRQEVKTRRADSVAAIDNEFVATLGSRLINGKDEDVRENLWYKWCEHLWQSRRGKGRTGRQLPQLFNSFYPKEEANKEEAKKVCGQSIERQHGFEKRAVIYDHHGELHSKMQGSEHDECVLFWEPYRAFEPQAALFEKPPEDATLKQILELQFLEAGLIQVALLDERVQAAVDEPPGVTVGESPHEVSLPLRAVLRDMRIFVPEKACDLYRPDPRQIEDWVVKECTHLNFLVIHQGVLDRLGEADPRAWIENLVRDAGVDHLVVCSGRGIPSRRPKASRFVPLSSVLQWTVHTKSKYHLCQLLFASRRPRNGK
jgi:hypothetical protein